MNVLQLMIYISHQKIERIDEYLQLGGLFNPELANHQSVSKLIIDCRDLIKDLIKQIEDSDKMLFNQSQTIREQHEIIERCNQTIKELRFVNVLEREGNKMDARETIAKIIRERAIIHWDTYDVLNSDQLAVLIIESVIGREYKSSPVDPLVMDEIGRKIGEIK